MITNFFQQNQAPWNLGLTQIILIPAKDSATCMDHFNPLAFATWNARS